MVTDGLDFPAALGAVAAAVEAEMTALLGDDSEAPSRVTEAMRYAVLAGGKRLRPFLVVTVADLFEVPRPRALRVAAALEFVHTYSLVHDDLPCMDDDDLRRGQPTVHRQFDEATAVLAGDGLLTRAFDILADPATHPDGAVRADLVRRLALAAGPRGMVGGQALDLAAAEARLDIAAINRLQSLKTGALIRFACEAGAVLAGVNDQLERLGSYAEALGLAFQIADDLLDTEGDAAELGKAVGKDAALGKATYVALLGPDEARRRARALAERAASEVDHWGPRAALLKEVAEFAVRRRV
ncbi:polyprenyl synthetase family protein [Oceanibacterium hippocampi]|uniref:Farnesyl diphosphate synthase n=1 Tax=Oceanibacterium hippocampi TaxID=745714 RepID=A0A1Y5TZW9_9PROT|nr:farnesyl diphosphate synthase [Oceanibacterium hippocampi]SLN72918.1 Farnesyl diphosphate synthase [Oceanibacterium hippocampi]